MFPGGGLYFWWQLGAVERLREEDGAPVGDVVGASAGALAAVLYLCDVDGRAARELALDLTVESGRILGRGAWGLVGNWGPVVRRWLEELLPEDAAERCARARLLHLRRRRWRIERAAAGPFADRDDVVDAALASAHVPLALDGRLFARYGGRRVIDGSFRLKDPARERRAVAKAVGRDDPDYVRVDWRASIPDKGKLTDAFELPGQSAPEIAAWLDATTARGYAWADARLAPGGALEGFRGTNVS